MVEELNHPFEKTGDAASETEKHGDDDVSGPSFGPLSEVDDLSEELDNADY